MGGLIWWLMNLTYSLPFLTLYLETVNFLQGPLKGFNQKVKRLLKFQRRREVCFSSNKRLIAMMTIQRRDRNWIVVTISSSSSSFFSSLSTSHLTPLASVNKTLWKQMLSLRPQSSSLRPIWQACAGSVSFYCWCVLCDTMWGEILKRNKQPRLGHPATICRADGRFGSISLHSLAFGLDQGGAGLAGVCQCYYGDVCRTVGCNGLLKHDWCFPWHK